MTTNNNTFKTTENESDMSKTTPELTKQSKETAERLPEASDSPSASFTEDSATTTTESVKSLSESLTEPSSEVEVEDDEFADENAINSADEATSRQALESIGSSDLSDSSRARLTKYEENLRKSQQYLDDDNEFLAGSSETITEQQSMAIVQGMENVVAWEVVNYLNDNGKARSSRSMKNDPPVLRINSSDGAGAEFVVTDELARTLSRIFTDIHKSYYGVQPKSIDEVYAVTPAEKISRFIKANAVRLSILGALIVAFIVVSIIF